MKDFNKDFEFLERFAKIVKKLFDSFIEKYENNPILKEKLNKTITKNFSFEEIVI